MAGRDQVRELAIARGTAQGQERTGLSPVCDAGETQTSEAGPPEEVGWEPSYLASLPTSPPATTWEAGKARQLPQQRGPRGSRHAHLRVARLELNHSALLIGDD